MKTKFIFATATAVGLILATGAYADNNQATVEQNGDDNTAWIGQDGDGNWVGLPNSLHVYGHTEQNGDDNTLSINQNGDGNRVARGLGGTSGNIFQTGNMNAIDITQTDHRNFVGGVHQTANNGSVVTNNLTILQDTDGVGGNSHHTVRIITQINDRGNVTSLADQNSIDVLQRGGGYGLGNAFATGTQNGRGNMIDVDELGTSNAIFVINQNGRYNTATAYLDGDQNLLSLIDQLTNGNTATVSLSGNQNGTGEFGFYKPYGAGPASIYTTPGSHLAIDPFTGDAALVANVVQSEIVQMGGTGNTLSYIVDGDYNLYGFTQNGAGNTIGGTVVGDGNQAAIDQQGDGNVTDFLQTGDGNIVAASSEGNNNLLDISQNSDGNQMTVDIDGNNNNNFALTGNGFEGDALAARDDATPTLGSTLTQGKLIQDGDLNQATITVASSDNAFATYQDGNNNTITHSITALGGSNQAVVVQIGNDNNSATTQNGSGNIVGISQ